MNKKNKHLILIATLMALGMATVFWILSSGWSLRLTFIPGVLLAYVLFLLTITRKAPDPKKLLPLYLLAVAIQTLHFAEEYLTGFYDKFPELFEGAAYPVDTFVVFNMCAYFLFILGAVMIYRKMREPMMIPLFFIAYGVIGNAISHLVFAIVAGGYFPGLYTSFAYWILGPLLLRALWQGTR